MNTTEAQSLWQKLQAAGLVSGAAPLPRAPGAPWYVRLMLGVAGWIGAVFLLIFVGLGLSFVLQSASAAFTAGLGACVVAGVMFRAKPDNDFISQFALAVSLAGQGLILFALLEAWNGDHNAIALGMALFQGLLFATIPHFVHRVWTAWSGTYAIVFALAEWNLQAYMPGLLSLACAWVWLNEFRYAERSALFRPGGYGLVLSLMGAAGLVAGSASAWWWHHVWQTSPENEYHQWIGAGLGGVALLWTVNQLLQRESVAPGSRAGLGLLAGTGILALAALQAPGLAPATLILLLGYGNGNRVLAGLGIAALLGYLSFYYYSLETTLLHKSILMGGTGLALLASRFLLLKWWPAPRQLETDHG